MVIHGSRSRDVNVQQSLKPNPLRAPSSDHPVVVVGLVSATENADWITDDPGQIRLHIPASNRTTNLSVWIGRVTEQRSLEGFARMLSQAKSPGSLESLTHGGPAKWDTVLTTQGKIGESEGPFAADDLTLPLNNPWHSWMRLGGFDFLDHGHRAAVCTWQGDVWIVDGLETESLDQLKWRRIATGLFQPLGIKVRDGDIFVLGRDQITRLHDLNGDGETDYYENFNNDAQVTEHFHEFAMDLQTDSAGKLLLYQGRSARARRRGATAWNLDSGQSEWNSFRDPGSRLSRSERTAGQR